MDRIQKEHIIKDLNKKMAFIVGPRQVGKTWLALEICKEYDNYIYLNYDSFSDRKIITEEEWPNKTELLVLDELHKMPNWKNYLKGVYDTKPKGLKILITGSARLEIYRQIGDSLAGRYFLHHLFPFTLAELDKINVTLDEDLLIKRGGFPEPLLADSDINAQRWRSQYTDSLIHTDILELQHIENLRSIRLIFELLRERVGSSVSYTSIAEDVAIAPNTVKRYINLLESLYIIFRVTPYSKNIARSILKEPKIYFFDNGLVKGNIGPKLENLVALSLYKHAKIKSDFLGKNINLHYLRTKEGQEVDFCITSNDHVKLLLEVKNKNDSLAPSLLYFHKKYNIPAIQIVKELKHEKTKHGIDIKYAKNYLKQLFI